MSKIQLHIMYAMMCPKGAEALPIAVCYDVREPKGAEALSLCTSSPQALA